MCDLMLDIFPALNVGVFRLFCSRKVFQRFQLPSDSITYIDEALASYPAMNSSIVETVMDCAGDRASVSVQSYLAETGLLTLNTEAGEAALINEFVDALYDSGLFREIDYTGYTYSEARDTYTINVLCYLQEHAGKEEVAQP